jgi:hypothetical protein
MPDSQDLSQLSAYFTACETLAESLFADMPADRRTHLANWTAAVLESLRDEAISLSDLQLILGSLGGLAVWEDEVPDGIEKQDLRDHARNVMIGAFERGSDGISSLDLSEKARKPGSSD